jgi:Methyltransferase domain
LTAWCLSRSLPKATVYTLDIPIDQRRTVTSLATEAIGNRLRDTHMTCSFMNGNWSSSGGYLARFDFSRWRGTCDIVYVDGAHSPEYVASDTRNAFEMLSPTGAIVWDDYWWRVPEVSAVLDSIRHAELFKIADTRLVVHLSRGAKERLTA